MAKKGRKGSTAGQNRWEAALMQCPFEEDTWKVNIQFVIEAERLDETHINALANVVKIPQRRLFSYLHKNDLMNMVNELGNPKGKKPAKVPQFFEITEVIYGLQNAGQEIPLPLWAKLIKFGLLNIKAEAMRKKDEASDKGKTAKGSGKKRARSKSPGGKKGKKTPETQAPKKNWSNLLKRGEENNENKYIDDEPKIGPQHYILISGFRKSQLLVILEEIGIYVNGVIKMESESYETLRNLEKERSLEEELDEEAQAQLNTKHENESRELALFWKLLPKILENAPAVSRLHDCAVHANPVRDVLYPGNWDNQDNMIGYGGAIFEDVSTRIYDSLDWHRQYANYLTNINLLHVSEFGKEDKPPAAEERATPVPPVASQQGKRDKLSKVPEPAQMGTDEVVPAISPPPKAVDTRYYQDLINSVPMESVSVSLMMHCLLEQVVATEEDKTPPTEKEIPARSDGIHLALADCIAESLEGLCLSEEDEQVLAWDFPQFKEKKEETREKERIPQGPVLLHYGDDISVRTHHLKPFEGFNPKESELTLLTHFPSAKLLSNESMSMQEAYERMSRLHELHRYTTNAGKEGEKLEPVSEKDVNRALELFIFESMNIANVDQEGNLREADTEETGNAWDDPYCVAARKLVSEVLSNAEDQDKSVSDSTEKLPINKEQRYFSQQRILQDYIYAETFKTPVLLQMLEEARHAYPCMDTYHSKRDNATYVMFHYPMTDNYQCKSNWTTCLHSDVGFRNYLEHVANRIGQWTLMEEQKYHAQQLAMELEKLAQKEAEHTPPPTAKRPKSGKGSKKGSRKGSPGRKGSPSRASSKAGGASEVVQKFSTPYIRAGSLKGDDELMAKVRDDEERMKKEKESKQSSRKSPNKDKGGRKSATSRRNSGSKTPTGRDSAIRKKSGKKSPKSRSRSQSGYAENAPLQEISMLQVPELPFIGYDVGNNLIHVHGDSTYLYPCDGGTIKVEKIRFEHGQVFVKTTLLKDGHVFVLHVLEPMNPQDDEELSALLRGPPEKPAAEATLEKTDGEAITKPTDANVKENSDDVKRITSAELLQGRKEGDRSYHSLFSSWCANLCDGMTLSFSKNGPDGINQAAVRAREKLTKILSDIPPATTPTPAPPGGDTPKKGKKSPKGGRSPKSKSPRSKSPKGKKGKDAEKDAEAQRLEELRIQEELEKKLQEAKEAEELEKKRRRKPKFQHIYTSCPDGLAIRFELDSTSLVEKPDCEMDEYKLMVRQSYPYKTAGKQDTEKARSKPAMEEVSRVLLNDGRVIKIMKDGSTKILFSDGTVCFNAGSGPLVNENRVPPTPASAHSGGSNAQVQALSEEMRTANSAGSKKGSKGRRSSGKTLEASVTEASTAGTLGVAAGLEAEAGARLEADMEKADSWVTTYMSGEVTVTKPNGTEVYQNPLLCYTATDPVTGEVMISREDKVVRVDRSDGSSVCDHTDGTRITKYSREVEQEESAEECNLNNQVWFVRIECPGFATVTFNTSDSSCAATFGSGSTITCSIEGSYQLLHWNGGRIDISSDGSVMYTPRPNNDLLIAALSNVEDEEAETEKIETSKPDSSGSYLMCHHADVCCEALDQEGNVYQVKSSGDVNVISSESLKHASEEEELEEEAHPVKIDLSEHHPPRLFVIHSDGSGTELLRYKDVQEYIGDAQLDPITAVIREPLPENMKVTGITVMRPHFGNSGDAWVLQKEEQNIIPADLKTRDLVKYPQSDLIKPGPPFGTTAGKGLAIGSAPPPIVPPPAPMCPNALELRQLLQYDTISQNMRDHMTAKVLDYGRAVCEQESQREKMQVQEPRTTEEQMRARDLLQLVLEFDEKATHRTPDNSATSSAILDQQNSLHKFPTLIPDQQESPTVKVKYEAAVAPRPPAAASAPEPKLTQEDWERIKRELEDERMGRLALKNRDVPPYFDSDEGRAWLLTQAPNMKAAQLQMVTDPRKDGSEARMYDHSRHEDNDRFGSMSSLNQETTSKVRPTNPTPGHAIGGGTPTKVRPENPTPIAAEPRGSRPNNPTPGLVLASQRSEVMYQPSPIPENPTSAQQRDSIRTSTESSAPKLFSEFSNNTSSSLIPIDTDSDFVLTKSLLYDVTGKVRKERVRLPTSILSDKPGAIPNQKFLSVEEEVRRKVKTSSVAGGLMQGNRRSAERGFQLLPPEVVFGVLREGTTYSFTVRLRNVGVDSCRFKIKQPPPGTGLKIHFTPGPVAAGMESKLVVEIYAIAVGVEGDSGVGTINHLLEIVAESEIIRLPITALVLTAQDYDNRTENMPAGHKAPGVVVSSTTPPLRDGIVRPRRVAVE